jgi:hypothetical protein
MTKDNSTGKNKDFYDLGKAMFDRIRVLPEHQAIPQSIPQKHSSKRMTDVFKLIEANGLTLHGDIEHFAALIRADEREACAKVCEETNDGTPYNQALECAQAIRARGQA